MDFGAVLCKPMAPLCGQCPFKKTCVAFAEGKVAQLPVKQKKIVVKNRWFYYFIPSFRGKVPVLTRTAKDIWQGLTEFPLLEVSGEQSLKVILKQAEKNGILPKDGYKLEIVSPLFRQTLSHQLIAGQFISVQLKKKPTSAAKWKWVDRKELSAEAFPQFINQYLKSTATQTVLF